MDMSKFLVDTYFVDNEHAAKYMMGSSDPESLQLKDTVRDFSKYEEMSLGYTLGSGYLPLCEKLARLYQTLTPDQIAVMNGGEETIYVTMRALLKPGDEIVVHMPSFQSLSVIAQDIGCQVSDYRPSFEHGWKFDFHLLESKITERTKLLVLNYPHNPTGACLTDSDMSAVARLCKGRDLYLVSDEVYRFLSIENGYTMNSFADLYDKAIALGSFSKTFASPALRVGWIAVKNQGIMDKLLAYRHFTSTCINLLSQLAASELLDQGKSIIQRNNAIIQRNAALLREFISSHQQFFSYVTPKGATTAYVKLLGNQCAMAFCMEILDHTGVLLVPSSVLEASDEYIRMGLGRESFPECIRLVSNYLKKRIGQ